MIGTWTLAGIADALAGTLSRGDATFASVSTDTRTLRTGELFVALQGENFDGDSFVVEAQAKGAAAALVGRRIECSLPQLQVADTTRALGLLGRLNRLRSDAVVIAITGSQGKTSVKEMTGQILSGVAKTHMTQGNLNNAIGAPKTLLQLQADHRFAVMELGANGPGEIAWTVSLVSPRVAVINNAAATHLAGFGSLDGVASAKGELLEGLEPEGVAVLNRDDSYFGVWARRAGRHRVVSFALMDAAADYRAEGIQLDARQHARFVLVTPRGSATVSLPVPGLHNVANALAASAAAMEAGAALQDVADGLARITAVKGRMYEMQGIRGSRLIDDSYNASPSSFRAAIRVLEACRGYRVLVMGDMAELGAGSMEAHREVGSRAKAAGIECLLTLGPQSGVAAEAFGEGAAHFDSMQDLIKSCSGLMHGDTTVLVKGSRSANMDKIVDQLKTQEAM